MFVKISNLRTAASGAGKRDAKSLARAKLGLHPEEILSCHVVSSSVDARGRFPVLQRSFVLETSRPPRRGEWTECDPPERPALRLPEPSPSLKSVIVVGTGPGGIFAAQALAAAGVRVQIFDRGFAVEKRVADRGEFLKSRVLNEESNLLCGEGGAGTFSDGKLYTGTKGTERDFVLQSYADAAGIPEITFQQRPHIGSDKLISAAVYFREKLQNAGSVFHFGVNIDSVLLENGLCRGVRSVSGEVFEADAVMIFAGLGARRLAGRLIEQKIPYELKPFQLGCRVEHPQELIDRSMYHLPSRPEALGAAEYHWVSHPKDAGACATFCMCPGGEVVMASAWSNQLTTNGMSYFDRGGEFADSALVTTIPPELFRDAGAAWEFLEDLERRAFVMGGGDYTCPAQDVAAFLQGRDQLKNRRSSVRTGIRPGRIDQLLYPGHARSVAAAAKYFERFVPGFVRYGKFIGQESCVSSPVRFLRDPAMLHVPGIANLCLGGEFAGCAGGIVSAAADGIRLAGALLQHFDRW